MVSLCFIKEVFILLSKIFNCAIKTIRYMEQIIQSINFNIAYCFVFRIININFTINLYILFEGQPSTFYSFYEPVFLLDDGWNKQLKQVVELNKNLYTWLTELSYLESKMNTYLVNIWQQVRQTEHNTCSCCNQSNVQMCL
jgi:hypothetical protein